MSGTNENQQNEQLKIAIITSKEVDGIEMGVLNDGTPFLTGRGLARACGISNSNIVAITNSYAQGGGQPRDVKIAELLLAQGFEGGHLYVDVSDETQIQPVHAFPDAVCMAFLEYYAFEAGQNKKTAALNSYCLLARQSLREYIYKMTGYDPMRQSLNS